MQCSISNNRQRSLKTPAHAGAWGFLFRQIKKTEGGIGLEQFNFDEKQRIIQEFVPGKQVTLAHVIAAPDAELYQKLGWEKQGAIGSVTLTPGETSIIAADIASKAASIKIGFLDRFTGSLVIAGDVASVEAGLREINQVLETMLGYTPCKITKT